MAGGLDFAGMVPGFDFLQSLMKGAGAAMPAMGQWVAPTLDPAELEKRIGELKTVQFWLEQNAKLLGTTIQAMEVQRMTLATLQTMNLPMADLRDVLSIRTPSPSPTSSLFSPRPSPAPASEPAPRPAPPAAVESADAEAPEPDEAAALPIAAAVDPVKWWGALTQQFTEIASKAMQAGATDLPDPEAAPVAAPRSDTAAAAKSPARKKAATKPRAAAGSTASGGGRKTAGKTAGKRRT